MMNHISRDVIDAGISFDVQVPDNWLEFPNDQAVLTLAGDLGQPAGTLRPSVTWEILVAEADHAQALSQLRDQWLALPEAKLVAEQSALAPWPQASVVVVFRNPDTHAAQIAVVHAQHVPTAVPVLVQAVGSCGGAAGIAVVEQLSAIVRSTQVSIAEAPATA
jgi:hypothetical protein